MIPEEYGRPEAAPWSAWQILKQSSWDWEEVSTDKRGHSGPVAVKRENWK